MEVLFKAESFHNLKVKVRRNVDSVWGNNVWCTQRCSDSSNVCVYIELLHKETDVIILIN